MHPTRLMTHSLRSTPWGEKVAHILASALQAVEPGAAVGRFLQCEGDWLWASERSYDLSLFRCIQLAAIGKAAAPMARSAVEILGSRLSGGIVLTKDGHLGDPSALPGLECLEAGHPVPDERGLQAAGKIATMLSGSQPDDLLLLLISGGGSALLVSPVPGISLDDLQTLTASLLACGADIQEINTLRKHLETLKGGGLARLAFPGTLIALILSDVVGDPLDVIASGPTVPDPTTYAEALEVLERYDLLGQTPPIILEHLQAGNIGQVPETPKPGDTLFDKVQNLIVGSNLQAAQAGLEAASQAGFHSLLLTTYLQGEARQAGCTLGSILRQVAASGQPLPRPACLVAGGETTVTLQTGWQAGCLGGRNQELALGAVAELVGLGDVLLAALATDGGDGPTEAAGAVVNGETLQRARQAGLLPADFLARNDAYHFFEPLGDLLKTGPTQTNVNDLVFLFAF
jgi:glycerate 2-kinase